MSDASAATFEFDNAREWLDSAVQEPMEPLAAEVWVFDADLAHVLLVRHRWRAWVPRGGKVEFGETPRNGAVRELFEETRSSLGLAWRAGRGGSPLVPSRLAANAVSLVRGGGCRVDATGR